MSALDEVIKSFYIILGFLAIYPIWLYLCNQMNKEFRKVGDQEVK